MVSEETETVPGISLAKCIDNTGTRYEYPCTGCLDDRYAYVCRPSLTGLIYSLGNHDFDFGYSHLTKLIQDTTFVGINRLSIDSLVSSSPNSIALAVEQYHRLEYLTCARAHP